MNQQRFDYEPLRRLQVTDQKTGVARLQRPADIVGEPGNATRNDSGQGSPPVQLINENFTLRRGHLFSYLGLFLFTTVVYFRPYEFIPSLRGATSMAFWIAVFTLIVFIPTQFATEGTITTRPREVTLVLMLALAALLSIPFGDDVNRSWDAFSDYLKVIVMFIVMVNVVRTKWRLQGLLLLALAVSVYLSVNAFGDYRAGIFKSDGYRVVGIIGNMFSNPNDLALHLVTIAPIVVGLLLGTRNVFLKIFYGVCAFLMVGAVTLTYSRGGFLGLISVAAFLAWRLGRRRRILTYTAMVIAIVFFITLAPGGYGNRVAEIVGNDGSAVARSNTLTHSIKVMLRYPIFGVGMSNYILRSDNNIVTHNAYTQIGSEMGIVAMVIYIMFIITPLKRLRQIERETLESRRHNARFYYLAVGLQASLVGYLVSSFFASVCYLWNVYYLVGYAVCLHRMYLANTAATTSSGKSWTHKS